MPLKVVHDDRDEIPEQHQDLYEERDGKWVLTGIQGVKTQEDIGRLQRAIDKEKSEHKATKDTLKQWSTIGESPDVVQGMIDRIPDLEAASEGKLDEDKIQELAESKVEKLLKQKVAPFERETNKTKAELSEAQQELANLRHEKKKRTIEDALRKELVAQKIYPDYHEDALLWGMNSLDVDDEGNVVTREGLNGVPQGIPANEWFEGELLPKRPGWIAASRGGGARGSNLRGGGYSGTNPWMPKPAWNVTKQGQILREDPEKAKRMAEAAGVDVHAANPNESKK